MPLTVSYTEGNGIFDDRLSISIGLPDSGNAIAVSGTVQLAATSGGQSPSGDVLPPILQPAQNVTATLTAPAPPASGVVYYNVQIDGATGAASLQSSPTSPPPLNTPTSRIVFSQTLTPASTDDATAGGDSTPMQPLGGA